MNFINRFQLIKGRDVILYEKTLTGLDPFGAPIEEETAVTVHDVIIQPADTVNSSVLSELQLEGKRLQYILHIRKDDEHDWDNVSVGFYGKRWKTFGAMKIYDPDNTPGEHNKMVKVEAYE